MATDQFSCGIFHMPHNPPTTQMQTWRTPPQPHVLFTLVSEVLTVSERLADLAAQVRWAVWADMILSQMDMEAKADIDAWRARLGAAHGRCWLIIGSACGDVSVLGNKGTEEARAGLNTGVFLFLFFLRPIGRWLIALECKEAYQDPICEEVDTYDQSTRLHKYMAKDSLDY